MTTLLFTIVLFALAMAGMAIGVLAGRKPISGSCGGLNLDTGSRSCAACSRPCRRARAKARQARSAADDDRALT